MDKIMPAYFSSQSLVLDQEPLHKLLAYKDQLTYILTKMQESGKVVNFNKEGQVILKFLLAVSIPEKDKKIIAIMNVAQDLNQVKSARSVGMLAIQRFIWEILSIWSKKMKICGERDSQFENLLCLYQDSPQLSRLYDEILIKVQSSQYSKNQQGNPQAAGFSSPSRSRFRV